ncbi:hypothetical protein C2S51_029696 [Perilla frutescens var. frutescens]|nr:hypothetical protein C2S51_029696 [Perilla frutescens var. frutescens]
MGKRRSLFSALKRAITRESKENRDKANWRRRGCFRRQMSVDSRAEKAAVVQATPPPPPMEEVKLLEAENEQNRHAYSVALVTAMAAEAAVAAANAAAEVVRLRAAAYTSGKTKEEIAAIKIQAAFRGYMARRVLRALRGLVRLKSVVGGKSVKRQAAASLKCMQTVARLQSEIRARRIRLSEENSTIQRQLLQRHEKELEKSRASNAENWDESMQSKEEIEAKIHSRQEAAMRRERALAYSYSHQTCRDTSNSTNQTFVDPNNPGWGWSWLERWMAARPFERGDAAEDATKNGLLAAKGASGRAVSLQSPAAQGGSRPPSRPSTPKSRAAGRIRPPSPRGVIGTDDDSKSLNSTQSEQCPRLSIAGSSIRDDDSLSSSPAVPGYMAFTESARAKSRLPSPQGSETPGSVKKRLSFSGSPARPRRPSTPTRAGASP